PPRTSAEELALRLQQERNYAADTLVRYEGGLRQVLGWRELPEEDDGPPIAFKEGGVYLITGGLGGLGLLFAEEILARTREARVVLAGRSPLTPEKDALLKGLSSRVSYRQTDVSDLEQVKQLIAGIREERGHLSGILHAAGVIADDFILKKGAAQFRE